jgi:hypothetical protein
MVEAMHGRSETEATAIGQLFGSALIQGGEAWMNAQKELLSGIEAMLESCLRLNRAALDTSARTLRKLHGYPSLAELFRLPQEWAAEYWQCAAAIVPAAAEEGVRAAQAAAIRPYEAAEAVRADIRVRREPARESATEAVTAAG